MHSLSEFRRGACVRAAGASALSVTWAASGRAVAVPNAHAGRIERVAPDDETDVACGVAWSRPCDLQYALAVLASPGDEI